MEHAVFYPGPDGAPAFRRFSSLEEAVGLVEHLRNVEGVEDVSVHMLTPVPLAFRAYYRVEMPAADPLAAQALEAELPVVPEQPMAVEPVLPVEPVEPAEPVDAVAPDPLEAELMEPVGAEPDVAANGKRSLGFFAH